MNPISDRGPAPSFYDPPREIEQVPCGACEGTGKFGCTDKCKMPELMVVNGYYFPVDPVAYAEWEAWEPHCLKNHRCPMKCKNGFVQ